MSVVNFNNFSHVDAYGRNTGLTASTGALGLLAFINVYLLMKYFEIKLQNLVWFIATIGCLIFSGSKTFIVASFVLTLFFIPTLLIKNIFRPLPVLILTPLIVFPLYLLNTTDIVLEIPGITQIERLFRYAFEYQIPSSIISRFEIWNLYLDIQSKNFLYYIFGVPKELLQIYNSTFDSDIVFVFVRMGLIGMIIYLFIIIKCVTFLIRYKLFFELIFVILIVLASTMIGVITDPQGSSFIILLLLYIKKICDKNIQEAL